MAVFGVTLKLLKAMGIAFEPVLATTPHLQDRVRAASEHWEVQPRIVVSDEHARGSDDGRRQRRLPTAGGRRVRLRPRTQSGAALRQPIRS